MDAKLKTLATHNFSSSWQFFKDDLKNKYGDAIYNSWFSSLSLVAEDHSTVTLAVRSRFIKEWILVNYLDDVKTIAKEYKHDLLKLSLVVNQEEAKANEDAGAAQEVATKVLANNSNDNQDSLSSKLDPRLTFTNFALGEENKLAFAAVKSVLNKGGFTDHINSVYLYSKVGLGKTHLLSALAHELNKTGDSYNIFTSERYAYHFSRAIANQDLMSFKEKLYQLDYLLLDDIQFLQGKTGTHQELVNLVSHLVSNNKKIIFVGDRKINDFNNLDSKLKSIMSGGIVAALANPGTDLKEKIIRQKLLENGCNLNESMIQFLAEQYFFNVREIEGAINKILIHQNILGEEVTEGNIADIIKDFISKTRNTVVTPDLIIKLLAKHYKLTAHELKSKKRNKEIVYVRDIAIFLSKEITQLSLAEIGKFFARDHATILHSFRKVEKLQQKDLVLKFEIEKIREMIQNAN